MVLTFDGLFGKGKNLFPESPEDGQMQVYNGNRNIPTDVPAASSDTVTLTPLEGALNTLELQAAASIIPGNYLGVNMDITTDTTGYLNTIHIGSTTAFFVTNKYANNTTQDISVATGTYSTTGTWTMTSAVTGYMSKVNMRAWDVGTGNVRVDIIQGGSTLASKTQAVAGESDTAYNFTPADYSSMITAGTFTVVWTKTSGTIRIDYKTNAVFTGALCSMTSGAAPRGAHVYTASVVKKIIKTNAQPIAAGFGHFQIVAFRQATVGTGNVTCDISFDGGTNWQTDVAVNTNLAITNSGTSMIVKINLNGTGTGNTSECKGWGVQLWA